MVRSNQLSRLTYLSLACLALLLAFAVHQVRAADPDAEALLGEWQGTWASATGRSGNGPYFITIKKVEGEKVMGRSERPASGQSPESNWNFVGTLAGNVLTVTTADFRMELTVNGKNMTGWSLTRGFRYNLSLAHK